MIVWQEIIVDSARPSTSASPWVASERSYYKHTDESRLQSTTSLPNGARKRPRNTGRWYRFQLPNQLYRLLGLNLGGRLGP